jgi:hypothetical protein
MQLSAGDLSAAFSLPKHASCGPPAATACRNPDRARTLLLLSQLLLLLLAATLVKFTAKS